MTSRNTIVCVLGLFCLFHAEAASAQPRWGRGQMPQVGACFFEDANFGGRYFCLRNVDRLPSVPADMADKISSLRVFGSAEVTVFKDSQFRGRSARFLGDVRDLRREGWNDQISSMQVRRSASGWDANRIPQWGERAIPREGACFYRDADFRGPYFCVPRGGTYTMLPPSFNDSISSIRIIRAAVRIFQDKDFGGRSMDIGSDVANLREGWRDKISSIRVF